MMRTSYRSLRRIACIALATTLALAALTRTIGAQEDQRADSAREARLAWFRDAKYGMFIHWGLYAIPAGQWKGKTVLGLGEIGRASCRERGIKNVRGVACHKQ